MNKRFAFTQVVLLVGLFVLSSLWLGKPSLQAAEIYTETFDTPLVSSWVDSYGSPLALESSGGNPGYYLSGHSEDRSWIRTTSNQFIGDYASVGITSISYDIRCYNGSVQTQLSLYSNNGGWGYPLGHIWVGENDDWVTIDIPVDTSWTDAQAEAAGWYNKFALGYSFADNMQQVENLSIFVYQSQPFGLDNVSIIPEPSTICLLGLGGLVLRKRRT